MRCRILHQVHCESALMSGRPFVLSLFPTKGKSQSGSEREDDVDDAPTLDHPARSTLYFGLAVRSTSTRESNTNSTWYATLAEGIMGDPSPWSP